MPMDARKRQRKLERRKAKQRAERRELARKQSRGMASQLREAAAAPVLHCCTIEELWNRGIGNVLLSRKLRNGNVAFSMFLVDIWCLGVKDVMTDIVPLGTYDRKVYQRLADHYSLVSLKPECLRKLVEGAVRYASDLGLPPHEDYAKAKMIFGDIRAEDCTEDYVFGREGKPFFCQGPTDDRDKCQRILAALENHCGPGGYNFLLQGRFPGGALPDFDDGNEDDDQYGDDYDEPGFNDADSPKLLG